MISKFLKGIKTQLSNFDILLLALVVFLTWQLFVSHQHNVMNTGYEYGAGRRVKVNTKVANSSWAYHQNMFKSKIGEPLTPEYLNKELSYTEGTVNATRVPLGTLFHNPDTLVFSNYTLKGILLNKIRTSSSGSDYIILRTPVGDVRVYYFGSLPYQSNNTPVEVTGIVLGLPDDNPSDKVSLISNIENTKDAPK